jgi:NAD(P)H-dependent flavin oxidoreductase YrpB (nitropropane dioxygenase family)
MIRTPVCDLLGIDVPIFLGGMGSGTSAPIVAEVSEAGAFGILGLNSRKAAEVPALFAEVRQRTNRPFGANFLMFRMPEDCFAAALQEKPAVVSFAWPRPHEDMRPWFDRAHEAGAKVMFMAAEVPQLEQALAAGTDILVAQGSEGGGHVGWMGTMPLVPMAVDVAGDVPVLAAGGIADGRGIAASLALGAQGVLLGTRFLATIEAPIHENFKQAIIASNGHDTVITDIPDVARAQVWPGAMARSLRNRFIERWAGRDWALRANQHEAAQALAQAHQDGNVDEAALLMGQDAGLIGSIVPARELVASLAAEAERVLTDRLPALAAPVIAR